MSAPAPTDRPALHTRALNLWYDEFHALKNVNTDISDGKITALIGPSGCGKSTLLRCFNRLNERQPRVRTTGDVMVFGENVYGADVSLGELRRVVGMVFQRPNPLPISIYENVLFGLRVHAAARGLGRRRRDDIVEAALTDVLLWNDVKDDLGRRATLLTLEQQQKLCIARLLPLMPRVLLMDEPCSALDADATEAIEHLMVTLRSRFTIVIVTHNMGQARRVSDECVFMLLGEVVEQGSTLDIFLTPQQKATELYVEGRYG
ncbi:MAG TPA: phosphate ABC transporter ATP-binding protein [Vicinamibacterales bacterium]|nr:phosphate ABC transporter ATP-binding protein [Vicinamibacterales bacterium]